MRLDKNYIVTELGRRVRWSVNSVW